MRIAAYFLGFISLISLPLAAQQEAREIDWVELMPAHLLDKLESLPMLEHDYSEDAADPFTDEWRDPYADAWNEILTSTEVVDIYEGDLIKLPGFIVPLDFDERQRVLSFFFVPYFGACIHVPPPPPNQLIHVADTSNAPTLTVDDMYTAFWITGKLSIEMTDHELGTAAYSLTLESIKPYQYGY